jgi:hypothetical protein
MDSRPLWALLGSNLIRVSQVDLELAIRNYRHDPRGRKRNNPKRDKIRGRKGLESCWTPYAWALLGSHLIRASNTHLELSTHNLRHSPRGRETNDPKRDKIRDRKGLECCWTPYAWALLGSNLIRVSQTDLELATHYLRHNPRGKQATRNATRFETEKDSNLGGLTSNVGTTGIEPYPRKQHTPRTSHPKLPA